MNLFGTPSCPGREGRSNQTCATTSPVAATTRKCDLVRQVWMPAKQVWTPAKSVASDSANAARRRKKPGGFAHAGEADCFRPACAKTPAGLSPGQTDLFVEKGCQETKPGNPISARSSSAAPPPSPPPMPDARDDEHDCGCRKVGIIRCWPGYDYRLQRRCESATSVTLYCAPAGGSQISELAPVLAHQLQAFRLAAFSTSTSDKSVGLAGMTR